MPDVDWSGSRSRSVRWTGARARTTVTGTTGTTHDHGHTHEHLAHVAVVARPVGDGHLPSLVFPASSRPVATSCSRRGAPTHVALRVDVTGGEVTSTSLADSAWTVDRRSPRTPRVRRFHLRTRRPWRAVGRCPGVHTRGRARASVPGSPAVPGRTSPCAAGRPLASRVGSRAMAETQRWEYLTAPILVHAAKQILDNFGADGWELVQVAPGDEPGEHGRLLQAPGDRLMGAVEDRLAELGLSVPDVAKPVASYVPAVRTGSYVYTSGQLPMRSGELMTTGKVGGAVSPEEAARVRPAVRAQRDRRGQGRDRRPRRREAGRQGRLLRGVGARASPVSRRSPTAPPTCWARRSATRACTRGPRSAYPCCRWTPRSRSRSSSRSDVRVALPPQLVEHARDFADGTPYAGRAARRGHRRADAARGPTGPSSTCCAGRRRWRSPAGCACSPEAASTPATSTRGRLVRARSRRCGPSSC